MYEDIRFLPSLRMIADDIEEKYPDVKFFGVTNAHQLKGICFFRPGMAMETHYAYIAKAEDLAGQDPPKTHCSLILLGNLPKDWKKDFYTILHFPKETDLLELMNLCLESFRKYISWAEELRNILIREGSVDELCRASYVYFQNPLFVHDSQLHVISCPVWREGMIQWTRDERTGLMITPFEELSELKTSREYLNTLTTRNAQIFSADLRGYRDIYVNIWDMYGGYEGRLVICEIDNPLKPGQFAMAEYLAELVRLTLARRGPMDNTYKRDLEVMLQGILQGIEYTDSEITNRIKQCGWRMDDSYVCIRMDAKEQEGSPGSAVSMCNYVEARVVGSKAVNRENQICIIVNLSMNSHYTSDIATILRDGLFKAGFSNVFHDFTRLRHYCRQASIALKYCRKKNDMMWHYSFDDIVMDYIADLCSTDFMPEDLCTCELIRLREYDAENKTELYKTLSTYILNERNTVAASASLYVGRSTLFYRLRKIKEITGLDTSQMAEPVQNLYLRLSIYIMEKFYK